MRSYEADATLPYPFTQSAEVKSIIGPKGEGLHGPLVKHSKLGPTIHATVRFSRGGLYADAVVVKEHEAATREAAALFNSINELVARGKEMESLRQTTNLGRPKECGIRMRRNLADYDALDRRVQALPPALDGRNELSIAVAGARFCVTCTPSAMRSCRDAASQLAEVRQLLRGYQSAQRH